MHFNRELLASITFEPGERCDSDEECVSEASQSGASDHHSAQHHTDTNAPHQNEATRMVIRCLKLALTKSITSISQPEKQRPLDPAKDFTIKTSMKFSAQHEGIPCCGPRSSYVKQPRARQKPNALSYLVAHDDDDDDDDDHQAAPRRRRAAESFIFENIVTTKYGDLDSSRGRGYRQHADRRHNRTLSFTDDDDDDGEEDTAPIDFKFTDYSPMCYRHIREFFEVDSKTYCDVIGGSRWQSIPTPGKSAAQLFFCGRDWVIKTMNAEESTFLRAILHRYYYHVRDNSYTLLPHFVGHHSLEIGPTKHYFIVMQNVFATTNTIHEKFDLKGSTVGRYASEADKLRSTYTQKDLDIHSPIHVGAKRRRVLIAQIKKDCDFLRRSMIMDYSFLVGIHILPPGGRGFSGAASPTLNAVDLGNSANGLLPRTASMRSATLGSLRVNQNGSFINRHLSHVPAGLDQTRELAAANHAHRIPVDGRCFTSEEGGMLSNDVPGLRREIYYIGIIDILQQYNVRKTLENVWFAIPYDRKRISCVNPDDYAARFVAFMSSIIV